MANLLSLLKLQASLMAAIMRSRFSAEDKLNALRSAVAGFTDATGAISFEDLKIASVTDKPCAFEENSAPPSPEMFDLIPEEELSLLEEELSLLKLQASLKSATILNALRSAVAAQNPTDPMATISFFKDLKLKLSRAFASVTDKPCAFEENSAPPSPEMFDLILEELCGVGKCRQLPLAQCTPEDECDAESENTEQDAECNTVFEATKQDTMLNALRSAVAAQNPTDPTATISFFKDLKSKLSRAFASVTGKPCAFDEIFEITEVEKSKQAAASTVPRCN